jgi:MFS family permease
MKKESPIAIALAGLVALAVAMGIGRFAFTPILPMMQREGLASIASGGWLASANYLGYFVGALSAMFVRIAPATAIRLGLAAIVLTTLAMALDGHMASWIAWRTIAGIASAWVLVFGSAWALERLTALGRPTLGGAVFTGVGVGIAIAGLACLASMRVDASANQAWIVLAVMAAIGTAFAWPIVGRGASRPSAQALHFDLHGFAKLTLCYGALGFGYIVPATFLPAMAREAIPDPAIFGWTWPIFGIAAAASTLFAAPLARAIGYRKLWILANLVMAGGVAIPLASTGVTALLASAILVGATFMVITMAGLQEARRLGGPRSRELIAAMTSAFALGQILGPIVVSVLASRGAGYEAALALATIALALSSVALSAAEKER